MPFLVFIKLTHVQTIPQTIKAAVIIYGNNKKNFYQHISTDRFAQVYSNQSDALV